MQERERVNSQKRKKNSPIHVSIIGSCVCRDVFSLAKNAEGYGQNENEYVVDRFIQSINPLAAVGEKLPEELAGKLVRESSVSSATNFYKRNFKLDAQKSWDDYLSEVKSDWLIVDFSTMRLEILCYESSYITRELSEQVMKGQIALPDDAQLRRLSQGRRLGLWELRTDELEQIVETYLERLQQIYPQKQIIVLDVKHVFTYLDRKEITVPSPNELTDWKYRRENELIEFAYELAKKRMPKAYFVDELPVSVGDVRHIWGRCGLHYLEDIYLYFLRCVDRITNHAGSRAAIELDLLRLQNDFSRIVFRKYYQVATRCIQQTRNLLNLEAGMKPGVYKKNGLTLTVDEDRSFHITGRATADTVFFLYSAHGNPCGDWKSVEQPIPKGLYAFTTHTAEVKGEYYVQLVASSETTEQKWLSGHLTSRYILETPYTHVIVRSVIYKGATVNVNGFLCLEQLEAN